MMTFSALRTRVAAWVIRSLTCWTAAAWPPPRRCCRHRVRTTFELARRSSRSSIWERRAPRPSSHSMPSRAAVMRGNDDAEPALQMCPYRRRLRARPGRCLAPRIGSAMGASGCMNIRACLDPAMPTSAADRALVMAAPEPGSRGIWIYKRAAMGGLAGRPEGNVTRPCRSSGCRPGPGCWSAGGWPGARPGRSRPAAPPRDLGRPARCPGRRPGR